MSFVLNTFYTSQNYLTLLEDIAFITFTAHYQNIQNFFLQLQIPQNLSHHQQMQNIKNFSQNLNVILLKVNYIMNFYRILVQPAKSSKSKCKTCGLQIQKNQLRVQMRDDRRLNDYIQKHGGYQNFQGGQGMSRGGYIQTDQGSISVEKYFIHLNCYNPIHPHPYTAECFKKQKFSQKQQEEFQEWLNKKANEPQPKNSRSNNKRKVIKKERKVEK